VKDAILDALAAIPRNRDALNGVDDKIADAIRRIQVALIDLGVRVPAHVTYGSQEPPHERCVLSYGKREGSWHILWGTETEDDETRDVPLLSAPRHVRGEVFMAMSGSPLTPMECLIREVAAQLQACAEERNALVGVAARIAGVVEAALPRKP
jgi:hypothetical protein